MQQAGPLEVKANAQLGAHQRGVAEPAKGACESARKKWRWPFRKTDNFVDKHRTQVGIGFGHATDSPGKVLHLGFERGN